MRLGKWYESYITLERKRHLAEFVLDVPLLEESVGTFRRLPLCESNEHRTGVPGT